MLNSSANPDSQLPLAEAAVIEGPGNGRHWGLLGTVLWGVVIATVFVAIQTIAVMTYITYGEAALTEEQLRTLINEQKDNGVGISLATLLTTFLCVPLVLGIAKLKRGSCLGEYLVIRAVPLKALGQWLGLTALFMLASDGLTAARGQPIVPEFMASAYASADPAWLLWLALVIAAPLFEEVFFRGFLFRGLEGAISPTGVIIVTAGLWAGIHTQYDLYGIGTIFIAGLLLGVARKRANSLAAPLAMHALMNLVACGEAALQAHRVFA